MWGGRDRETGWGPVLVLGPAHPRLLEALVLRSCQRMRKSSGREWKVVIPRWPKTQKDLWRQKGKVGAGHSCGSTGKTMSFLGRSQPAKGGRPHLYSGLSNPLRKWREDEDYLCSQELLSSHPFPFFLLFSLTPFFLRHVFPFSFFLGFSVSQQVEVSLALQPDHRVIAIYHLLYIFS